MFTVLALFIAAAHHLSQIEYRHKALDIKLFLIVTLVFLRLWDKKDIERRHVCETRQEIASTNDSPANNEK